MIARSCINCEWQAVYRHDLCAACWWYKRRHGGKNRPECLIVRHGQRVLEARRTRV